MLPGWQVWRLQVVSSMARRVPLGLAMCPSEGYGPDVCPRCYGVGRMRADVPVGDVLFGSMVECDSPQCMRRAHGLARLLWELSGFDPHAVDPPSLTNFLEHVPASITMLRAAEAFAANPQGWLVLHGNAKTKSFAQGKAGAGKSHLAEAIFRALLARGVPCMYILATDLFEYLGAKWRDDGDDTDYERRLARVLRTKVLIIDEFGREPESDAVSRLRHKIIDARWRAAIHGDGPAGASRGGATMLVSNLHPEAWADGTIASRALDWRFTVVEAPDVDFRKLPE